MAATRLAASMSVNVVVTFLMQRSSSWWVMVLLHDALRQKTMLSRRERRRLCIFCLEAMVVIASTDSATVKPTSQTKSSSSTRDSLTADTPSISSSPSSSPWMIMPYAVVHFFNSNHTPQPPNTPPIMKSSSTFNIILTTHLCKQYNIFDDNIYGHPPTNHPSLL